MRPIAEAALIIGPQSNVLVSQMSADESEGFPELTEAVHSNDNFVWLLPRSPNGNRQPNTIASHKHIFIDPGIHCRRPHGLISR